MDEPRLMERPFPGSDRRDFLRALGLSVAGWPVLGCSPRQSTVGLGGRVIVVGAGLSGLCTALLLEERGVEVTLLEARDRPGGRIHTLEDVPGRPEAGGPSVGGSYRRFIRVAGRLDVPLEPLGGFQSEIVVGVGGRCVRPEQWPSSPQNRTAAHEREIPPPALLGHYLERDNPLEDSSAWAAPRHAALDVPLDEYLRRLGASEEALRLIDVTPNTNHIGSSSALWALKDAQRRRDGHGPGAQQVAGGNSRLIEAAAAALMADVRAGCEVTCVRSVAGRVEVTCGSGARYQGDLAIVTLPFSVLRGIELDPPLEGLQREAVEQLPYTAITKYYVVPTRPFWEEDGLPATMWTDSALERIFAMQDANGRIESLVCWIDGRNAQILDAMPEKEQIGFVKAELARVRPATRGAVEIVRTLAWAKDPYALGAYAHFAPGQVSRLRNAMVKPWGRIHFAGEHTALTSSGLESAVESAERAANEALERLA